MNVGTAKKFLYIGYILSLTPLALSVILHRPVICYICLVVGAITASVWGMYGRCPHCGKFLHTPNKNCPYCNEKIES